MITAPSAVVAILGAGLARRFGSGKLAALLHGRSVGLWPLETAQSLGSPVVYITGRQRPAFLDAAVTTISNFEPERGLGSSIALAARHAQTVGAERLLVVLGDMPFVSTPTLQRLIELTAADGATACRYEDQTLGPPACFGSALFAQLEELDGDKGARALLRDAITLDVPTRELLDIDTAEQLAEFNRQSPLG